MDSARVADDINQRVAADSGKECLDQVTIVLLNLLSI
jgi:hypothetical protein